VIIYSSMISEIMAGILLVMAMFFLYIGIRSWKNMHERIFVYISFVFFAYLITPIIFIISDIISIIIPMWVYFIIDIAILLILYITLISR